MDNRARLDAARRGPAVYHYQSPEIAWALEGLCAEATFDGTVRESTTIQLTLTPEAMRDDNDMMRDYYGIPRPPFHGSSPSLSSSPTTPPTAPRQGSFGKGDPDNELRLGNTSPVRKPEVFTALDSDFSISAPNFPSSYSQSQLQGGMTSPSSSKIGRVFNKLKKNSNNNNSSNSHSLGNAVKGSYMITSND